MVFYRRKSTRLPNYDYSTCNYYFITICTNERKCIFGKPGCLNNLGKTAEEHIQKMPSYYQNVFIDKYIVMPNHVHMILKLQGEGNPPVTQIIGQYKRGVTNKIREKIPDMKVWQRSFHDHIIRSQATYEQIWLYIDANPQNWSKDQLYVE